MSKDVDPKKVATFCQQILNKYISTPVNIKPESENPKEPRYSIQANTQFDADPWTMFYKVFADKGFPEYSRDAKGIKTIQAFSDLIHNLINSDSRIEIYNNTHRCTSKRIDLEYKKL